MSEAIFERMRKAHDKAAERKAERVKRFIGRPIAQYRCIGDVGIEIEVEGRNLPRVIKYISPETGVVWTNHDDGSLRGENNEYVTGGAIKIAEVEPMVKALWDAFEAQGSKVKMSNRCSTHVHVNCGILTPKPITSLIALYGILEEAVTNWCGPDRVSNPFCLRMKDSRTSLEMWEELCTGENAVFEKHRNKYNALNLEPLWKQGSVEFRPMRGAEGPEHVIGWVRLLWALREAARTRYQNPLTLAMQVSARGVRALIEEIIEENALGDTWKSIVEHPANGNLDNLLREGFLIVQPLLFSTQWDVVEDREEEGYMEPDVFEKAKIAERIERFNNPEENAELGNMNVNEFIDAEEDAPVPRAMWVEPVAAAPRHAPARALPDDRRRRAERFLMEHPELRPAEDQGFGQHDQDWFVEELLFFWGVEGEMQVGFHWNANEQQYVLDNDDDAQGDDQ